MIRPRPRRGFSLIEILTAVAVLGVLVLIMGQITASITRTTKQSTRLIDASAQARVVFERIGFDLCGLIKRPDTDFLAQNFSEAQPKPILLFLSGVTSSGISASNNRKLSVIAYEVQPHPDNTGSDGTPRACLTRGGKPVAWTGSGLSAGFMGVQSTGLPLRFDSTAFPTALLPASIQDFDVLGAGVLRLVVAFQLYPDNRPVQLLDGGSPASGQAQGQIVYSPPARTLTSTTGASAQYADLNRVSAIIIGVVTIDTENARLLSADQALQLGKAFATPANTDNKTPVQAWTATANNVSGLPTTLPLPVRQSIRVYERAYPVTPFPTQTP